MARFLLLAVLVLAGCGGADAVAPPERPAEYAGLVEEADAGGRLLVRAAGDACGIWVAREPNARALRRTAAGRHEVISWEEVPSGARVELWIPGPVAESCPAQGAAEALVVTGTR